MEWLGYAPTPPAPSARDTFPLAASPLIPLSRTSPPILLLRRILSTNGPRATEEESTISGNLIEPRVQIACPAAPSERSKGARGQDLLVDALGRPNRPRGTFKREPKGWSPRGPRLSVWRLSPSRATSTTRRPVFPCVSFVSISMLR